MKLRRECMDCGKRFTATIDDETGKVLKGIYWGSHDFGLYLHWYRENGRDKDGNLKFKRDCSLLKWYWLYLVEFKRRLLHQYETIEFWTCPRCDKLDRG